MSGGTPGTILLISGPRGVGKTLLCSGLAARLQAVHWDLAGILSPGIYVCDQRVAIDALDLRTHERHTLAKLRTDQANPIQTQRWSFDAASLAWGNQVLQQAAPCDVLMVDEVGTLEFERSQGWTAGLEAIDAGHYRLALVVVRPELIETALLRWPAGQVVEIHSVAEARKLARSLHRSWGYNVAVR